MKTQKIIYWIATVLLCLTMLYSASMYFTETEKVKGFFESFNYPTYIVIPLAIAKIIGVIAILWNKITWIKGWAYAGFFFDLVLASAAHQVAGHGIGLSVYTILFLVVSYFLGKKVRV